MGWRSWFTSTLAPLCVFVCQVQLHISWLWRPSDTRRPELTDDCILSPSVSFSSPSNSFDPASTRACLVWKQCWTTRQLCEGFTVNRQTAAQTDRLADRASPPLPRLFIISSGSFDNRLSVKRGGINLILTIAGKTHTHTHVHSHTQCMPAFHRSPPQGLQPRCHALFTVCDILLPLFSHWNLFFFFFRKV